MDFLTEKDAKEFLVSEIVNEAVRKGNPLSEIERKMLYFTESGWTLSDMDDVAATFDRDYSQPEYEKKISQLAQSARKQLDVSKTKAWSSAVKRLSRGDHYLLVLLHLTKADGGIHKYWRVLAVILVICVAFLLAVTSYLGHFPDREEGGFFVWLAIATAFLAYLLGRLVFGRDAIERFVDRIHDAILIGRRSRSGSVKKE